MDIEKVRLNTKCPHCKEDIVLTFNTTKCPKCHQPYDSEEVKTAFYEYESQVVNSNAYKAGETGEKIGQGLQDVGSCLQNCGCIIMLLPIVLLILYLFFSML